MRSDQHLSTFIFPLQKHKNECKLQPLNCRNNGCVEVIPRGELDKHEQEECQYREINCQHCEERTTVVEEKVSWMYYVISHETCHETKDKYNVVCTI